MIGIGLKNCKKSITWVSVGFFRNLKVTLKLKLQTSFLSQTNITYRSYIFYSLKLVRLTVSKLQDKICEKCRNRITQVGVYGPQTQAKCLFKVCKKNKHKLNVFLKP